MNSNIKKDSNYTWQLIIAIVVIIICWLTNYYLLVDRTEGDRGTVGDMFGAVNSLFSGFALAGIIYTILLQRKELGLQRNELKETRQEFIIQNKTLKAQRFDSTFFNMLSLHNQIINDIDYDKKVGGKSRIPMRGKRDEPTQYLLVKGRDVFRDRFKGFKSEMSEASRKGIHNYEITYEKYYEERKTDFGHYFRNLYRIIKMVDTTIFVTKEEIKINTPEEISKERLHQIYLEENYKERYKYTSIIRAQLSDYELLFLFYNSLSKYGREKFKPLIERYKLFKNFPLHEVHDKKLLEIYCESAFK